MREETWMKVAEGELGTAEISGTKANPQIIEYHKATSLRATSDEVPWCSAFVNWVMREAGLKNTNSAAARSWLKYGSKIDKPIFGAICVFKRGTNPQSGHVGFFVGELPGGFIKVLGGNQGDKVKYSNYNKEDLLEYRWPVD